ncbi:unnamed protein product, partial [Rotaria sp. Silwood2]
MLTVQQWLKQYVRDVLDESDEILHVEYQLIYTVGGQEQGDGDAERWKGVATNTNNNRVRHTSVDGVPLPASFASHYSISHGVPLNENALNSFYSAFQCVGGNPGDFHTENGWPDRQCIFHNVCLRQSGANSKYIIDYFYPSSIKSLSSTLIRWNNTIIALRHGAGQFSDDARMAQVQLVPLNHLDRTDSNSNLSFLDETYLIYQILPDGDMNFGHVIFDDAF